MFVMRQTNFAKWALALLFFVLLSNFLLYRSPLSTTIIPEETFWVVSGSLFDLAVVAPLLLLASFRLSAKQFVALVAGGFIISRVIIPAVYFEPFSVLFYIGAGMEAVFLLAEVALLGLLIVHTPAIYRSIKSQSESPLFSLFPAAYERVKPNPLVSVILSEGLMFYYAFFSWRKKPMEGPHTVSLHKNTSAIAFYIMLIHAIVIETIGLHWWLHDKSVILSIVLLVLNLYSVVYFIGEIQAIRLHPLSIKDGNLKVALGLSKRMVVPLDAIQNIRWGDRPGKDALEFIAKDIEEPEAQVVIEFETPQPAYLFYGRTKYVKEIALRVDDPEKLKNLLEQRQTDNLG
ncbi:beta-carotene 15,15'-monooxygenase [Planococcus salinus]|uniref:Beta-carotene 15,15'-monooxygenase n=1 Tax=Planococcus salinus TaxID=1848460 RepID=A0A3M8P8N7_9BACL|nr:beta-carotene 15,15'-monooxygenase [Planococcus salinus]RNF40069.1 beta-carotene 15,15'-monooxygenase [Planococcus salinus]